MPDTKISALTDGATAERTDRIPVTRDPTGTPVNRYITPAYVRAYSSITPVYVSGRWYAPDSRDFAVAAGLAMSAANTLRLTPGVIHRTVSVTALAANVTTGEAGRNIQLGIYNSSATTAYPTTLVGRTASMTTDATGTKSASITGGAVTLQPGLYWWAINTDGTAVVCAVSTAGVMTAPIAIGSTTIANVLGVSATLTALTTADTFNTWTSDITSNSYTEITNNRRASLAFQVT
jgi:hypothetical protein